MDLSALPKNLAELRELIEHQDSSIDLTKIEIFKHEIVSLIDDDDYVIPTEGEFDEPEPDSSEFATDPTGQLQKAKVKKEWTAKKTAHAARTKALRTISREEKVAIVKAVEYFTTNRSVADLIIRKYEITTLAKFLSCSFLADYQNYLQINVPRLAFLLPSGYRTAFIMGQTWKDCSQMLSSIYADNGVVRNVANESSSGIEFRWKSICSMSNITSTGRSAFNTRELCNWFRSLMFDYTRNPVGTNEYILDQKDFASKDTWTPVLNLAALLFSTSDLKASEITSVLEKLAVKTQKSKDSLSAYDILNNRPLIHSAIDQIRAAKSKTPLVATDEQVVREQVQRANGNTAKLNIVQSSNQSNEPELAEVEDDEIKVQINRYQNGMILKTGPGHCPWAFGNNFRDFPSTKFSEWKRRKNYEGNRGNHSGSRGSRGSRGGRGGFRGSRGGQGRGGQNGRFDNKSRSVQNDNNTKDAEQKDYPADVLEQNGFEVYGGDQGNHGHDISDTVMFRPVFQLRRNDNGMKNLDLCLQNLITETDVIKKSLISIIYDTGADTSLCSYEFIRALSGSCVKKGKPHNFKSSMCASGNRLVTLPHFYELSLLINGHRLRLSNVLVGKHFPTDVCNQILIGMADIVKLKLRHEFSKKPDGTCGMKLLIGDNGVVLAEQGVPGKNSEFGLRSVQLESPSQNLNEMINSENIRSSNIRSFHEKLDGNDYDLNDIHQFKIPTKRPRKDIQKWMDGVTQWSSEILNKDMMIPDSIVAYNGHGCSESCEPCFKSGRAVRIVTEEVSAKCTTKHSDIDTMRMMEKDLLELRSSFTYKDVRIDPKNEILSDTPEGNSQRNRIWDVIFKHKRLFSSETGDVGSEYVIDADIDESILGQGENLAKNAVNKMSQRLKDLMALKWRKELANGTLVRAKSIRTMHFMHSFMVPKKSADGVELEMVTDPKDLRLIANCKPQINKFTKHKAGPADDAASALEKIVKYTEKGFVLSIDVADCFHTLRLNKRIQPYFGVYHPVLGSCHYTRLPQGFLASPMACKEFMDSILAKYNDKCVRYVDDIVAGSDSFDGLVQLLDEILGTLEYHGLKLKGSKVAILGKEYEFLGKVLKDGKIHPSPHHIEKIKMWSHEDMPKKKDVQAFIGLVQYLGGHVDHCSDLLHPLHRAISKSNGDFVWTPDLIECLEKTKSAMDKCRPLWPVDPNKHLYMAVDTSALATGAMLFQMGEDGPRVIGLFSRKRSDRENKSPTPSCVSELAGVAAATRHFYDKIDSLNDDKRLKVITDSMSAVRCYEKYCKTGAPSNTMRISSFIAEMYNCRFDMIFSPNISLEIEIADFMSRSSRLSKECPSDCSICKVAHSITACNIRAIQHGLTTFDIKPTWAVENEDWRKFDNQFDEDKVNFLDQFKENEHFRAYFREKHVSIDKDGLRNNKIDLLTAAKFNAFSRSKIIVYQGSLDSLFSENSVVRSWQDLDKNLRELRRLLEKGCDAPTSNGTIRTLMLNKGVHICPNSNNLFTKEEIGVNTVRRLVVPRYVTKNIIDLVHDNLGHHTQTQILGELKKLFLFTGENVDVDKSVRAQVADKTNRCPGCINLKPAKKMDRPMKETPIPRRINEVIYVDEFSRQSITNATWRFLFVSEALTRFSRCYPYRGDMNEKKFLQMLDKIKNDFCFMSSRGESKTIRILSDKLSCHVKAAKNAKLDDLNIKLEFHQSKSLSPNKLPELDGRLAKLSKFLRQEMTNPDATHESAAFAAAHKYNSTRSSEGFQPVELWTGTRSYTGDSFKVDVEQLRRSVARSRLAAREGADRRSGNDKFIQKPIVPYNEQNHNYESNEYSPIQLGDLILPKSDYNKNALRLWYEVSESPDCRLGVNFDDQYVVCRKLGAAARSNNIYVFSFDSICSIINGQSPEAQLHKLDLAKNKSCARLNWTMFKHGSRFQLKTGITNPYACYSRADGWSCDWANDEDDDELAIDIKMVPEDKQLKDETRKIVPDNINKNQERIQLDHQKSNTASTQEKMLAYPRNKLAKSNAGSSGRRNGLSPGTLKPSPKIEPEVKTEPPVLITKVKKNRRSELERLIDCHTEIIPSGTPRKTRSSRPTNG